MMRRLSRTRLVVISVALLSSTAARSQTSADARAKTTARAEAQDTKVDHDSAAHARAELVQGKLNPKKSKPGDRVVLQLQEDVRSEDHVLLEKGDKIEGVVKNARTVEGVKGDAGHRTFSMIEIEWLAPSARGQSSQSLSVVVQAIRQVSPLHRAEGESPFASALPSPEATSARSGGVLGGGVLGSVTHATGAAVGPIAGSTGTVVGSTSTAVRGTLGATQAGMAPTDARLQQMLSTDLGAASSASLQRMGSGEIVTAGGTRQSLDLFSRLQNDTIMASASKFFELTNGAEMQLLIIPRRQ